jgi:hypothetical protein
MTPDAQSVGVRGMLTDTTAKGALLVTTANSMRQS